MKHPLLSRRLLVRLAVVCTGLASLPAQAQLLFNVTDGVGSSTRILQWQGGTVSEVNTGVAHSSQPSPSRDGRFFTFSGVDPDRPNQASADLFVFDRATGQTSRLIDNTARTNRDQSIVSLLPLYSALSPNNRLVVVHTVVSVTSVNGGGTVEDLEIFDVNDQRQSLLVERSTGNSANLHRSEFMGISWSPDGSVFATSAALPVLAGDGVNTTSLPGIVTYAFNPNVAPFGAWQRAAQLSQPSGANFVDNFQVFPAFSPDGRRIAWFNVTANPLLTAPHVATLVVANADGSNATALATFSPGFFPNGLTWAGDGSLIIFSLGPQISTGAQFYARAVSGQCFVRAIDSVNGGNPFALPNLDGGFAPGNTFAVVTDPGGGGGGGGGGSTDLSQVPLSFSRTPSGFVLSATGLDPNATYQFESSTDLDTFPNSRLFSGADIMSGISIPRNETQKFFRIRNVAQ